MVELTDPSGPPPPAHVLSTLLPSDFTFSRPLPRLPPTLTGLSPLPRATPLDNIMLPSELDVVRPFIPPWMGEPLNKLASPCLLFLIYKWGTQRGTNP